MTGSGAATGAIAAGLATYFMLGHKLLRKLALRCGLDVRMSILAPALTDTTFTCNTHAANVNQAAALSHSLVHLAVPDQEHAG